MYGGLGEEDLSACMPKDENNVLSDLFSCKIDRLYILYSVRDTPNLRAQIFRQMLKFAKNINFCGKNLQNFLRPRSFAKSNCAW